jgi:hypothetical protein
LIPTRSFAVFLFTRITVPITRIRW